MNHHRKRFHTFLLLNPAVGFVLISGMVFVLVSLILRFSGVNPISAYALLADGSLGSLSYLGHVIKSWIPLTLCSVGLIYTFRINLWNIGIEGQVVMGAVCCTAFFRFFPDPSHSFFFLVIALVTAMIGGALWAVIAGLLKTACGVNEIFAGLGLNFVSQGLVLWLIFGPWKRPGIASMSGTTTISSAYILPESGAVHMSFLALFLVISSLILSFIVIRYSLFGLSLKAAGKNSSASLLLGLKPARLMIIALASCGALAGLAGFFQVGGVYHRLIPSVSSNYGYLAILVVLLSGYDLRYVPGISFFFACLNVGSIQLPMVLQMDSSLSGVIQGLFVLFYLFFLSIKNRFLTPVKEAGNE